MDKKLDFTLFCKMWFLIHILSFCNSVPNICCRISLHLWVRLQVTATDASLKCGNVTWWSLLRLLPWYPTLVKSMQLIWRSDTRRWNLRVSDLQNELHWLDGLGCASFAAPAMATRGTPYSLVFSACVLITNKRLSQMKTGLPLC